VLRALAVVFAFAAVCCMVLAIAGMVTQRQSERAGWRLRAIAVVCFVIAVVLNVASR
jgi:hypothetical protein